jgi:hypothetical protein
MNEVILLGKQLAGYSRVKYRLQAGTSNPESESGDKRPIHFIVEFDSRWLS